MRALVRFVGVVTGLFLVLVGVDTVFFLTSTANEPPPLASRVLSSLPALLTATVLLAPHRRIARRTTFRLLLGAHAIFVGLWLYKTMQSFVAVFNGTMDAMAIPAALGLITVLLLDMAALVSRYRSRLRDGQPLESGP